MHLRNADRMTPMTPTTPPVPMLPTSSRYELLHCVASGGMGAVYQGIQRGAAGFARPVAIKRAHPHLLASPGVREEILAEARLGAAVRHPNVVSIEDVEEVDGELLLVMDYVDGCALSTLMGSGTSGEVRLPRPVALRVMLDVCLGLAAIHAAKDLEGRRLGLVHCDVSPHNVLVSIHGIAQITDFGIATSARDRRPAAPHMRRGTFGYMAPEYLADGVSTARSDLFAVGVILWELLAGRRLFGGRRPIESVELTRAAVVPSLRAIDPTIPIALEEVVRRALARAPEARYRSIRELGDALERASRGLLAPREAIAELVAERRAPTSEPSSVDSGTMPVDTAEVELIPIRRPGTIFLPSVGARTKTPRRMAA